MWFQIGLLILAIILIAILLLQARGNNPSVFGQAESTFRVRQGVEKLLFRATILLSVVFVALAIATVHFG